MKRNKINCGSTQECMCPTASRARNEQPTYTFTYINEKLNAIYYDIPKCASTTIRTTLFKENMSLINPSKKIKEYFKFIFCRNPYARAVSNYTMFTKSKFRINQISHFHNNPSAMGFSEFVELICKYDNHHWQPQIDFVYGYDIDFIGKLENIEQDFRFVCDKIGIPHKELPHKNKTNHKHYTEYYDEETKQIVAEKYAKDIEYFGYEFGE